MTFVSLTTDYGTKDFYAAALRVKILERAEVDVVDLTHRIQPFNIAQAAYQVESALNLFPAGSIHCVDVAAAVGEKSRFVLFKFRNQFVVGCDNGLPRIILEYGQPDVCVSLNVNDLVQHLSFPAIDIFPHVVEHLVSGKDPLLLGDEIPPMEATTLKPIVHNKMIRTSVIHIDSYENVVLNIRKHDFEHTAQARNFVIQLRRGADLNSIHTQYADVGEYEMTAFFNTTGYLEVAINRGNLAGINNISVGDTVQIDFV